MFSGTHYATLDQKGRFTLPGPLRKHFSAAFSGAMVITQHPSDFNLIIYTAERWSELNTVFESEEDDHLHEFYSYLLRYAMDVDLDKNGRLLIPNLLRDFAQLEKNLLVRGHINRIEVWNESASKLDEARRLELLRSEEGIAKIRKARF